MRTFDPFGAGMEFYNEFKKAIDGICAAYDCVPTYNRFSKPRLPVVNNPEVAVFARKVIGEEIGAEKYLTLALGREWTGGDVMDDYCS